MKLYGKVWIAVLAVAIAALAAYGNLTTPPAHAAGPWYVAPAPTGNDGNTCLSSGSPCATINGAIAKASSGDTIYVAIGTYTGSGDRVVTLDKDATLSGGWDAGFTTQSGMSTIDGEDSRGGITVDSGVTATIERFVVQNGNSIGGGGGICNAGTLIINTSTFSNNNATTNNNGVVCNISSNGGGIHNTNTGILTLNNSIVNGNSVECNGSGVYNEGDFTSQGSIIRENTAGGIFCVGMAVMNTSGVMTLSNSIVNNNMPGGGLVNVNGTLSLANSTVSGNTSDDWNSGGITNWNGTITLNNGTISGNGTTGDGGGFLNGGSGTVTSQNTIFANNTASGNGPDCNGTIGSSGYNLVGDTSGCTLASTTGDLTNVDPKLGPLQDNGGPTETHALLTGSPALDAGSCNATTADQRGKSRPVDLLISANIDDGCDIGAYEVQSLESSAKTVNQSITLPGESLAYTITFNNGSTTNFATAQVTDTLPSSLTYIDNSLSATSGSYGHSNGVISWTGSLNAGGFVNITYGATVSDTVPLGTTISNSAMIDIGGEIVSHSTSVLVGRSIYLPIINVCGNYFDDFSDPGSGWLVGDFAEVLFEYFNGEYRIFTKNASFFYFVRTPSCKRQNYVVETDARWASTPGEAYGLVFGIKDTPTTFFNQYYLFDMNTDFREFRLLRRNSGGGFSTIVPITFNPAINSGTTSNHLKATRNGSQITLEVNGVVLGTWFDGTITGETDVGVVANPYNNNPNADARFDNFSITKLPGSSGISAPGLSNTAIGAGNLQNSGAARVPMPADIPGWSNDGN